MVAVSSFGLGSYIYYQKTQSTGPQNYWQADLKNTLVRNPQAQKDQEGLSRYLFSTRVLNDYFARERFRGILDQDLSVQTIGPKGWEEEVREFLHTQLFKQDSLLDGIKHFSQVSRSMAKNDTDEFYEDFIIEVQTFPTFIQRPQQPSLFKKYKHQSHLHTGELYNSISRLQNAPTALSERISENTLPRTAEVYQFVHGAITFYFNHSESLDSNIRLRYRRIYQINDKSELDLYLHRRKDDLTESEKSFKVERTHFQNKSSREFYVTVDLFQELTHDDQGLNLGAQTLSWTPGHIIPYQIEGSKEFFQLTEDEREKHQSGFLSIRGKLDNKNYYTRIDSLTYNLFDDSLDLESSKIFTTLSRSEVGLEGHFSLEQGYIQNSIEQLLSKTFKYDIVRSFRIDSFSPFPSFLAPELGETQAQSLYTPLPVQSF